MKATLMRSYKSEKGNVVFVYGVSGTPQELEAFAQAQDQYHRIDEQTGTPLWFTTRCIGDVGRLIITKNGKVVPDMSEYDKAASLAKQYGGNLGEQLSLLAAQRLMGMSSRIPSIKPEPQDTSEEVQDSDEQL